MPAHRLPSIICEKSKIERYDVVFSFDSLSKGAFQRLVGHMSGQKSFQQETVFVVLDVQYQIKSSQL